MAIIKKFRIKSFKKNNSVISFENVSLSYGHRLILDKINFAGYENAVGYYLGNVKCEADGENMTRGCPYSWRGKFGNITYKQLGYVDNVNEIIKSANLLFIDNEGKEDYVHLNLNEIMIKMLYDGNCFEIDMKKYVNSSNIHNLFSVDFTLMPNGINVEQIDFRIEDPN